MTNPSNAESERLMRLAKALGEECEALLEIRRALLGETSWIVGVGGGLLSSDQIQRHEALKSLAYGSPAPEAESAV